MEKVRSQQVLVATHTTKSSLTGTILGYFRRLGPNPWDDYRFVKDEGAMLQLLPGVPVMLEPNGAVFRVRSRGRVVRVRYQPPQVTSDARSGSRSHARAALLEQLLTPISAPTLLGGAGAIAKKLNEA